MRSILPIPSCLSLLALALLLLGSGMARAAGPEPLTEGEIDRLHALIRPHAGESPWMAIDWYPSVNEARRKAAAEGKPIFLSAASGGAPAAGC